MKIVLCYNTIRQLGGMEALLVFRANELSKIPGNEIWVVVTERTDSHRQLLLPEVNYVDLGIGYFDLQSRFPMNLFSLAILQRKHKRLLAALLKQIQPDIVVSIGGFEHALIPFIKGKWASVREIDFTSDYRRRMARNGKEMFAAICGEWLDNHYYIRKYDKLVLLTEEDRETYWRNYSRACVIPFPVRIVCDKPSALREKRVIALGRLFRQKNFISLIRIFRIVADRHPDWELYIYGEGEERKNLQNEITRLELDNNVFLKGRTDNVAEALQGASIFALSSIFEGLPNVVIEAMSCGLPVVSFKCPTGPKDMLTDGYDGFLIDNGNEKEFAERICDLIESESLRKEMGANALVASKRYSPDVVIDQWMTLFRNLVNS